MILTFKNRTTYPLQRPPLALMSAGTKSWLAVLVVLVIGIQALHGQDLMFSQPYTSPLYFNPAYAGLEEHTRIGGNYRHQWQSLGTPYLAASIFADHYLDQYNSGIGLNLVSEQLAQGALMKHLASLTYAYRVMFSRTAFLRLGLQASLGVNTVQPAKLIFPDLLDNLGEIHYSNQAQATVSKTYFDMAIGGVFSYQTFYFGGAIHHLIRTNQAVFEPQQVMSERRYTLHTGYNIYTGGQPNTARNTTYTHVILSPILIYQSQGKLKHMHTGCFVTLVGFSAGLFYKQALGHSARFYSFAGGYSNSHLTILYNFDFGQVSSALQQLPANTHEVALIFKIPNRYKPRRGGLGGSGYTSEVSPAL